MPSTLANSNDESLGLTLAACAYAGDSTCDNKHPKHSSRRCSVRSGGQHNADDQKDRGGNGACLAAQLVDDDAEAHHPATAC